MTTTQAWAIIRVAPQQNSSRRKRTSTGPLVGDATPGPRTEALAFPLGHAGSEVRPRGVESPRPVRGTKALNLVGGRSVKLSRALHRGARPVRDNQSTEGRGFLEPRSPESPPHARSPRMPGHSPASSTPARADKSSRTLHRRSRSYRRGAPPEGAQCPQEARLFSGTTLTSDRSRVSPRTDGEAALRRQAPG
jgi:hypothetical protein